MAFLGQHEKWIAKIGLQDCRNPHKNNSKNQEFRRKPIALIQRAFIVA